MAKTGKKEVPNVVRLLRGIQQREVNPRDIPNQDRMNLVEYLRLEGYSAVQAAEILNVNERTVRRDLDRIRRRNAVEFDPRFVGEMVGRLIQAADACSTHLRRRAKEKGHSLMEVTLAEQSVWKVERELVLTLQGLGFLPSAPTQITGDLRHSIEIESETVRAEVERLRVIGATAAITPGARVALDAVQKLIAPAQDQKQKNGGDDAAEAASRSA